MTKNLTKSRGLPHRDILWLSFLSVVVRFQKCILSAWSWWQSNIVQPFDIFIAITAKMSGDPPKNDIHLLFILSYQRTMIRANSIEGIREQQIVLFVEFEITTLIWLSEVITWIAHIWETTKAITHKQGCLGMRDPPILQIPNFCNFWYFSNLCLFWNETFISAILEDKHEMLSRAYWLHWVL